ncbi:MAG: R3H domain-containing nucleic acid-binding protein [Patescibacteria group bacterium]
MEDNQKLEFLKTTAAEILKHLGIPAEVNACRDEKGEVYQLDLSGTDLGVLIGYHGEGLSSLQLLLGLAAYRQFGEWLSLVVDADNYRKGREEKLRALAEGAMDKVRFLLRPVALPPLPANERRVVHMIIAEFADVVSESNGEGRDRHVVIKIRDAKNEPKTATVSVPATS